MEPALYAPEDLLGSDSREQHHARVPQVEEQTDLQSSNGWFSHWFRPSDARSASAADALDASSLSKPPFVSYLPLLRRAAVCVSRGSRAAAARSKTRGGLPRPLRVTQRVGFLPLGGREQPRMFGMQDCCTRPPNPAIPVPWSGCRVGGSLSHPAGVQTLRVQTNSSEQEEVQVEVTRLLVECYFDIARKNLQDAVPKAIMNFLVLYVQRGLQQRLIRTLYRWGASLHSSFPCAPFF